MEDKFKYTDISFTDLELIKSMDDATLKAAGVDVGELNENLSKALDKKGLVQREITVNGKNGTYMRKQWMSASDAKKIDNPKKKDDKMKDARKREEESRTPKQIPYSVKGISDKLKESTGKGLPDNTIKNIATIVYEDSNNMAINDHIAVSNDGSDTSDLFVTVGGTFNDPDQSFRVDKNGNSSMDEGYKNGNGEKPLLGDSIKDHKKDKP